MEILQFIGLNLQKGDKVQLYLDNKETDAVFLGYQMLKRKKSKVCAKPSVLPVFRFNGKQLTTLIEKIEEVIDYVWFQTDTIPHYFRIAISPQLDVYCSEFETGNWFPDWTPGDDWKTYDLKTGSDSEITETAKKHLRENTNASKNDIGEECFLTLSQIRSIKRITPMVWTGEHIDALIGLNSYSEKSARAAIITLMERYAANHPGRPVIYFPEEQTFVATLDSKYSSYTGDVGSLTIKNGQIEYEIFTDNGKKTAYDFLDGGNLYIESYVYLLETINHSLAVNTQPNDNYYNDKFFEEFYGFIKPGARVRFNNDSAYKDRPGPIVEIIKVHDDVINPTAIIDYKNGNPDSVFEVPFCTLEPLGEGE